MLSFLLLAASMPSALAQDYVVQVSEPVTWEQGGVWARPMPTDDGWKLFFATQNDFWVADLAQGDAFGDWELDRDSKINLTNRGNQQDNAVAECPDGSFLIASSASVVDPNDTSYWTWVSADFEVLNAGTVEETSNERSHNDLAVICNPTATGVVHAEFGSPEDDFESTLFHIEPTTGVTGTTLLKNVKAEGGTIIYDSRNGNLVASHASLYFQGKVTVFDDTLEVIDTEDVELATDGWKVTWPQGLLRVGEYWIVGTLARDEDVYGMGEFGDIFVTVLDADFEVQERLQVTEFLDDDTNANRPWLARDGSVVLVGFDKENRQGVVELELDLDAFGVGDGEDDGGSGDDGWTGGGSDDGGADGGSGTAGSDGGEGDAAGSGDEDDEGSGGGCGGCSAGGTAPALGLLGLGLLGLLRRREG